MGQLRDFTERGELEEENGLVNLPEHEERYTRDYVNSQSPDDDQAGLVQQIGVRRVLGRTRFQPWTLTNHQPALAITGTLESSAHHRSWFML